MLKIILILPSVLGILLIALGLNKLVKKTLIGLMLIMSGVGLTILTVLLYLFLTSRIVI